MATKGQTTTSTLIQKACAWAVHCYTGLGLVINMYCIHVALYATPPDFSLFARLNGLAILVDATDGTMARYFDVKKHASTFDGALLDNIIDFQTFSLLPALVVCIFNLVPGLNITVACVIVLASGYQFCQRSAKTTEAFVGFPSYWNLVVVYVHYLEPSYTLRCIMFFGFGILSFCPVHFIYPTRTKRFFRITITGAYVWGILIVAPTMMPDWKHSMLCMKVSLMYVVYYFGLSFYLDFVRRSEEAKLTSGKSQ